MIAISEDAAADADSWLFAAAAAAKYRAIKAAPSESLISDPTFSLSLSLA